MGMRTASEAGRRRKVSDWNRTWAMVLQAITVKSQNSEGAAKETVWVNGWLIAVGHWDSSLFFNRQSTCSS
jgi:hypothetical protein